MKISLPKIGKTITDPRYWGDHDTVIDKFYKAGKHFCFGNSGYHFDSFYYHCMQGLKLI